MKTTEEFLSYLCSLDVKLWVEENRLHCSAPKDVLTPVIKEELAERKEDVLAFIRNNSVALVADKQPIRPVKRQENLPLSFAQQRLWFLAQLEPDSPFYNLPAAVRLEGELNVEALQQTFNEIINRHEALRTNFQIIEGQAVAVISEEKPLNLSIFNISELPANKQEAEVKKLAFQEAQQPFDLKSDLLLRIKLLRLSKQEHIVLLTMHHMVSDGWSTGVLVQELATLYPAFCNRQAFLRDATRRSLPKLPIQYVDFAAWQRQWLQGEVLKSQISYWLKHLENAPRVLDLPTDYPRPAIQTFGGATYSFELSKELSATLNKLSQQQGSTLFMTLLAAFQILLWRYTLSEDIVVGSPIANRNRAEIEGLIGFFVNTLVLRTNLAGNPSFEELLKQVREVALGAYAHQDLPFELLVEQLQPQRDLSHTPLFQVMFVLQNAPMSALELAGLTLTPLESDTGTAQFDLTLSMTQTESGLVGSIEYNTDLFEENTICRMSGHFQTLLKEISVNPKLRLSELSLLTESEKRQLLLEWNNTEVEYPKEQCIHQLFEAQVESTPDAVAVVFEDQQLTYSELNAKANQLAHYLQKLGVKPEVLVGICVERSLSMLIGLLAILKAGGAYVPLDPAYPPERLAFILQDAQVSVLLTQQHLIENLPQRQTRVVCLDTDWENVAQQSSQNPISESTIDNLAYIIYTSGSTGQPKGVLVNHSNVVRLLAATEHWYNFNQHDVWTLFHSIAFDFSVWEIWGALLYGGKLVVIPYWLSRSPEDFYKLLLTQKVTILNQTPSAFSQLIQVEELLANSNNLALRKVIFGGEALQIESLRPWFERHGDQSPELINMYGITETTVHVTYRPLTMADLEVASASLIGRPIGDLQVYLLDRYRQPVPIGVPGEMYIGGAGVVRGYLNRPTLTSERFIPNCFSNKPNARLYKTGDLARYLPNGDIEYLGRIDNQVKVRGFRIELGEIEAIISQHPAVRETVVVVNEASADSQRIVAYVVAQREQTLIIPELRNFLESKLPNYMVPTAFITLEALPLTPNGKVDRKALKAPDTARPELETVYQPPQTEIEKTIADIWQEVLNIEDVGIHDNFFQIGGHSLLLVQVHSKLQKTFQRDFILVEMFQHPTVGHLARYFSQEAKEEISFIKHSHIPEGRTASLQRRKQARKEHRTAIKEGGVSSQSGEQNL
ncbi:MAG: amino acid adenylation domain-containing protein [Nostoc sp. DedQUE12b]|uniref:non-ribosomal peptide synthetase n=1 Tax=Nostoc sp. DedQUE12b TaxID=3075398 RepID=UPI002AD43F04|nr:amino acid adenylation domain-containing protein [Nostoc sp. DedQUE12b]MDZ8084262.1 amino acid adenylation domain-containing protein [Nostoc sp. DedQUE12b]